MRVFAVRPVLDVFDGSGTLSPDADAALAAIADLVVKHLREGGDNSHHAVVWDGPSMIERLGSIVPVPDEERMVALARKLLDPNNYAEGDIRSAINCRAVSFGQDGQAIICLRHEDSTPQLPHSGLVTMQDVSEWLTQTDLLDGSTNI